MIASKPQDDNEVAINQNAIRQSELYTAGRSVLQNMIGEEYSDDEDALQEGDQNIDTFEGFGDDSAGIGYVRPPAQEGAAGHTRHANAATEKLRRQMLGKRATSQNIRNGKSQNLAAATPRPRPAKRKDDSDDEQDGRSGLGRKRKEVTLDQTTASQSQAPLPTEEERATSQRPVSTATPSAKKAGSSYLDQVLAERAAKRKKKKQRQAN